MGVQWWMDNMLFLVDYRSLNWLLLIICMAIAWTHRQTATHSRTSLCALRASRVSRKIIFWINIMWMNVELKCSNDMDIAEILWANIFTVPCFQWAVLLLPLLLFDLLVKQLYRSHIHLNHSTNSCCKQYLTITYVICSIEIPIDSN